MPFTERLAIIAAANGPDACWNWPGFCFDGYGKVGTNLDERGHRVWFAHRAAYTVLVGPVDSALELDHLCRNRRCMNPAHLEPVTPRENSLRSESPLAYNARKTHCAHGHTLTAENVRIVKTAYGRGRSCRACELANNRRYARERGVQPKGSAPYCGQGHAFTAENTIRRSDGRRRCRECDKKRRRDWARNDRAQKRAG